MGMTIAYLPYLYRFVIAGRGDATAIGRPRQGIDPIRMASIGEVMFHCNSRGPNVFHLPHLYQLIFAPTGDEVATGRPGKSACTGIPSGGIAVGNHVLAGSSMP